MQERENTDFFKGQELRSKEVQEIMGRIPTWILRWGNTFLAGIVLGLIIVSCIITYPDTVESNIWIESIPNSIPVYSTIDGVVVEWTEKQNKIVWAGERLGVVRGGEKECILTNPIDGVVDRINNCYVGKNVSSGELLCIMIPDTIDSYIGNMEIPSTLRDKVKCGQTVYVYLESYSYQDYGCLKGEISKVSSTLTLKGNVFVEVKFPNMLRTNGKIKIPKMANLKGTAKIVIQEVKLIEKFLQPIRKFYP